MMDRTEMLLAIQANDAINRLNDFFTSATGSKGLEGSRFEDVFFVSRLLYQNCSFYGTAKTKYGHAKSIPSFRGAFKNLTVPYIGAIIKGEERGGFHDERAYEAGEGRI